MDDAPSHRTSTRACTQEQIAELIRCIIDAKMTIIAASAKANMNVSTGYKYYRRYINNQKRQRITQEQITRLIRYIVVKKMSVAAASKKANMSVSAGYKHYNRYLVDV
jgi:hypothetical protein